MANPINDKYQELKQTEQEIFDAYPILKIGKPVAQTLLIPAIAANAVTYLPLAGPVVAGAIGHGTDFIQNNLHGLREAQVTKHFADLRQNIQPGFAYWARQRAFDDWATMRSADLLGKSDILTRPLAGYLAPSAIGKAMLDTAPVVAKYVTQLPISKTIGQTIAQTQAMFDNVQAWIQGSYQNIREYGRHTQAFMQKEANKLTNNQTPNQNQNAPKQDSDKQDVSQAVLGDSKTQLEPDLSQVKQGDKPEQKPEEVLRTEPQTQAPDVQEPVLDIDNEGIPEFLTQKRQEPDRVASDYFQGLASELAGKGIQADNMRLHFNGEEIFRLKDGQPDQSHTSINNAQMEAFKAALADPANFKGTLEIRQGNRLLLSIKDGQVFDPTNKVGEALQVKMDAPAQSIPDTTTEGFYQKASEGVKSQGVDRTVDIAQNAIKSGHSQAEITSMLLENDPMVKNLSERHGPEVARSHAQEFIQTASDKILMAKPETKQHLAQEQKQEQQQSQAIGQKM